MNIVYLDIEGTVVDDLQHSSKLLDNIDNISDAVNMADRIVIFSFAVFTKGEVEAARSIVKDCFSDFSGELEVMTVAGIASAIAKTLKITFLTEEELFMFFSKVSAFLAISQDKYGSGDNIVLVDDTVKLDSMITPMVEGAGPAIMLVNPAE